MKKVILAVVMMFCFVTAAVAAGIDQSAVVDAGFKNLSESQKAEIVKIVADKAADKTSSSQTTAVKVDEWLTVGERIGKGLGGAAKELGVAVNEFANTPVGKLTAFIIVWKFMGSMVVHIAFGLLFAVLGAIFLYSYARLRRSKEVIYDDTKKDIFGRSVIKKVEYGTLSHDDSITLLMSGIIILVVVVFTAFSGSW